jgi:hypothetical protein
MSPNNTPSSSGQSYLEQTVSLLSTVATYMRLPALASTVCATSFVARDFDFVLVSMIVP